MDEHEKMDQEECVGPHCSGCSSATCMSEGGEVEGNSEMKSMKKPELYAEGGYINPDNEDDQRGKRHNNERGVHRDHDSSGMSMAGVYSRNVNNNDSVYKGPNGKSKSFAKTEHERVLSEMKSMKKPNLYAEGGEIGMMPEHEGDMEDGDMESELNDALGDELLAAFESKDKKAIMSCIEAAVMSCMSKGE